MTESILNKSTDLEKIQSGLQAFDERRATLVSLAESAKDIDIIDFNDKITLKIVSEKRKELKAERVKVQNEGKDMRDMIRPITNYIIESEKELIAIIQPEEERLNGRENWVKLEIERVEQERIEAENARIQKRIDALAEYGYQIDYADIKSMSDETFGKYLEAAKTQFEKEQAEKAEQERLRIEQEEKERQEREAEAKRIETERLALEKMRKEQEEKEAEIKRQWEAIQEQQRQIEEEKRRVENEKRAEEEKVRRAEELRIAQEKAAEEARIKAIEDAKESERIKREAEEKARIAAERKSARQPDKIKILQYISNIKSIAQPELKTDEAKEVMQKIQELITRLDSFTTEKIETL